MVGARKHLSVSLRYLNYEQGQTPDPKTREYFYFIDHQGQVKPSFLPFLCWKYMCVCVKCPSTSTSPFNSMLQIFTTT